MATSLDQRIAQLEKIVETHLGLCNATRVRCTLPANHERDQPHDFAGDTGRRQGGKAATNGQ